MNTIRLKDESTDAALLRHAVERITEAVAVAGWLASALRVVEEVSDPNPLTQHVTYLLSNGWRMEREPLAYRRKATQFGYTYGIFDRSDRFVAGGLTKDAALKAASLNWAQVPFDLGEAGVRAED